MADVYIDPLEAAKRRQVPKNTGVSYFPGVNPPTGVRFGGALSAPSLTPEAVWQAQFRPGNIATQTASQPMRTATQFTNMDAPIIGQSLRSATPFTNIRALTQGGQPLRTASGTPNLDADVEELVKRYAY